MKMRVAVIYYWVYREGTTLTVYTSNMSNIDINYKKTYTLYNVSIKNIKVLPRHALQG